MTAAVSIEPVDRSTFRACSDLAVRVGQEGFVATNVFSIAQACIEPTFAPMTIRVAADESEPGTVVGFAMYGQHVETGQWWIIRLMIGAEHQGHGYGSAAVAALIERLVARHGVTEIRLGCVVGNERARTLYERYGFRDTGEVDDNEAILLWNG